MAQFKFKLQTVLEQRETEERRCQAVLASARQQEAALQTQLSDVERQIVEQNESMRDNHLVGKLDVAVLATHRRYLIAMRQNVILLAQRIATARLAVEQAQRKVAAAAKERKTLEMLRDRQKERASADLARKDLALADDVGMQMAFHDLTVAAAADEGRR